MYVAVYSYYESGSYAAAGNFLVDTEVFFGTFKVTCEIILKSEIVCVPVGGGMYGSIISYL